jgi:gamma-glutamyltranspeptidase / glutathione hydrolase
MKYMLNFASRRSPVISRNGIVAASQPLAVAAGLKILEQGGSAADAAVATAAALNVTEPSSTGIGGDCFALFYDASTRQVTALNGSGRAPHSLSLERLQREGMRQLPMYHPYTITVPGACAGWCDLIERHGRLPLNTILAPAIRLAAEGFPVAPLTAHSWQRAAEGQLSRSLNGREMTLQGRGPGMGEVFRNPGLARRCSECRRRQERLLPGRDRRSHRPHRAASRRLPERGRFGRPHQHLGDAYPHHLPRPAHL